MEANKLPFKTVGLEVSVTGLTALNFAEGIAYQTLEGLWRLKFNIVVTLSNNTNQHDFTVTGVKFKKGTNILQAITIFDGDVTNRNQDQFFSGYALQDSNTLRAVSSSIFDPNTQIGLSGDVALEEKPDFVE